MRTEDMILVSVDDHVIEPRGMFDGLLPAKYQDKAPKLVRQDDGTDVWLYDGNQIPNVGLNAVVGRPPEEYGIEPTSLEDMRVGCYDVHERVRDMSVNGVLGSMCFPSFPQFCGQLFARREDKDEALRHGAGLQRLAHRPVVRRRARALHPAVDPGHLGPRAGCRGSAPGGQEGLPRRHLLGEPREARLAVAAQRALGPLLDGLRRRGHRRLHAPGLVVADPDDLDRGADRRDDQPAADQHGAGGGRPDLVAHPAQVQGPALRPLRGRHRLDPLRPRAHRLRLPAPPQVDGSGLRRPAAEPGLQGPRHHLLHRRRLRRAEPPVLEHRQHHVGVRLPALGLDVAAVPRGAHEVSRRRVRRGHRQDDAPQRHEALPVRPLQRAAAREVHRGGAAGRGRRRRHLAGLPGPWADETSTRRAS